MTAAADRIVEDLGRLVAELETLIADAKDTGERMGHRARGHIDDLQAGLARRLSRTAKTADETIRENPWPSVAIAASAALLLGIALGRGATKSEPAPAPPPVPGANGRR